MENDNRISVSFDLFCEGIESTTKIDALKLFLKNSKGDNYVSKYIIATIIGYDLRDDKKEVME